MRLSVPSWQKGGHSNFQAFLVEHSSHMHHMMNSIHQADYEMHQRMKILLHPKHGFPVAWLSPPASGQEHPRGFSSLRAILVIACESIDWPYFVACRTFVPVKLATDYFSCRSR